MGVPNASNEELDEDRSLREIGGEAVWTLSSAKPGNGVLQLRDNSVDTFWQSDGQQPHLVNIQFNCCMNIKELALYVDEKLDESYTPNRISIRSGTNFNDIQETQILNLEHPSGWVKVQLTPSVHQNPQDDCLKANIVQLAVLASHQNGRDTHIRQIKIYGSRQPETVGLNTPMSRFTTLEFAQDAVMR